MWQPKTGRARQDTKRQYYGEHSLERERIRSEYKRLVQSLIATYDIAILAYWECVRYPIAKKLKN